MILRGAPWRQSPEVGFGTSPRSRESVLKLSELSRRALKLDFSRRGFDEVDGPDGCLQARLASANQRLVPNTDSRMARLGQNPPPLIIANT